MQPGKVPRTHLSSVEPEAGKTRREASRRFYCPPRVLSAEHLEVVAANCDGSGAVGKLGNPVCNPNGPFSS